MYTIIGFCFGLMLLQYAGVAYKESVTQERQAEIACLTKNGKFEKINAFETMCTVEK